MISAVNWEFAISVVNRVKLAIQIKDDYYTNEKNVKIRKMYDNFR